MYGAYPPLVRAVDGGKEFAMHLNHHSSMTQGILWALLFSAIIWLMLAGALVLVIRH